MEMFCYQVENDVTITCISKFQCLEIFTQGYQEMTVSWRQVYFLHVNCYGSQEVSVCILNVVLETLPRVWY